MRSGSRALVALVVLGTCVEHALFAFSGHVFPRDLNSAYRALPEIYAQMGRGEAGAVLHRAIEPGGWYNAVIAAWLHAVGRSGVAFTSVGIASVAVLILATAGLARRWHGDGAAVASAALVATIPVLMLGARGGWIHAPEAALVLLAALLAPGGLAVRAAASPARYVAVAVCGALVIALRPSGLLWTGLLGLAVLPVRRMPAAMVGIAWLLAAAIPLPMLRMYVGTKIGVRARYAEGMPGLGEQIWTHLEPVALTLVLIGLATYRGASPDRARRLLIGGWLLVPLGLLAAFRTGLDNFPLFYVAIALVAGHGLGSRRGLVALAFVGWAVVTGQRAAADLAPMSTLPAVRRVQALVDATCPARCAVVVDQGLFFPQSEEPGILELFLLREERIRILSLHQRRLPVNIDALATWSCGERDARWRDRFPAHDAELAAMVARAALAVAWSGEAEGCTFSWLTPGGTLAYPGRAPR